MVIEKCGTSDQITYVRSPDLEIRDLLRVRARPPRPQITIA
jgi:hypothetical protein